MAPAVCSAKVVPFCARAPPLKIPVAVSLAVKEISSVPILISPDVGKADESVKVTLVTPASAAIVDTRVVVAAPEADPDHVPVPKPYPPNC